MKKIVLSLVFIFIFFNLNITNSYNSISATKTEIDNIKCDLNYTGELRQGFSYEFSDSFSNTKNSDIKIEEVKVHIYEQSDYNNSTNLPGFDFTSWAKTKNKILSAGDSGKLIESTSKYQIAKIDTLQNKENFKITYTAKFFTKSSNGDFTTGPYYHTECKNYKVTGCGDGLLDKDYGEKCDFNDPDKKNWGNDGCSNTCQPKTKKSTPFTPNPVCKNTISTINSGIEKLETLITCNGTDVSTFKIDCGNGDFFTKNGKAKGNESFSKQCNYTKPGKYTATCKVNNKPINNSCTQNIEVKEKIITPIKEKEDLSEYEKYVKKVIFEHKANKIKLKIKEKEELERGIGLIKLPKILPKTGTPILDRVKKLSNSKLNLDLIDSRFRLAGNKNSNIDFWKQALPNQDKNAKKYIVIPSSGLVMPINDIPDSEIDYNSLLSGREIKVNKYLKSGAMEYAGTSINGYGKVGNKVVFAHSSYFKSDNGRYKTDFQKIIKLDKGEEIWIYEKTLNGNYKRYKYKTVQSYNTKPTNVSVLKPGIGKNLTLFTCTPIGGISGRWVVEAKFIDDEKLELENKIKFNNINSNLKSKIDTLVYKISKLTKEKKKEKILKIFKILIAKEPKIKNEKIINILKYLKYKLAIEFYK